jgi:hypothetical protein
MFNQVLRSVDGAPYHYVKFNREWVDIARSNVGQQ